MNRNSKQLDLFARRIYVGERVISEDPYVKLLGHITVGLKPYHGTALAQYNNALVIVEVKLDDEYR